MEPSLDTLLHNAINNAIVTNMVNVYRNNVNERNNVNRINLSRRYYNTPPSGGYIVNEEEEYVLHDIDDISSRILLDIVTQFGSPGNDSFISRKEKLKKIKYKKVKTDDPLKDQCCSICLDNFTPGEFERTLDCSHTYHKRCIDKWFKKDHIDCPMCRCKAI
jgi:hypothetical protein